MRFEIPQWLKYEIEARLEQFRNAANKNPRIVWSITIASVFILFLTIIYVLSSNGNRPDIDETTKAWYYDLNTGKLFKADDDLTYPIKAPSGPLPNGQPAGVRAYVYTYINEPNEDEILIGYLEKPNPNAVQSNDVESIITRKGKLIRTIEDSNWVLPVSQKGRGIIKQITERNEKGRIPRHYPPE